MILALLLQTAVPPAAPAPPATGPVQPPATMVVEPVAMAIAAWDANRDGRTSRAELDAGVRASLPAPTGYIGFADWAQTWLGDRNALPSPFEVDADGDNRVTPAELDAAMVRVFDRLDRDHDGAVSRAECLTIRAQVDGAAGNRRGKRPSR